MMHHVHTGEAVVTTPKIDIFWACHHEAYNALRTIRMHTKLCWRVWYGHWVALGEQKRNIKLLRCSPQGVLHAYMNVHTKYIHSIICGTGGKFWSTSKCIFFAIRR